MKKLKNKELKNYSSVMLINNEGINQGEMDVKQAEKMAKEQELDLILMDPKQNPPVCRIGDYGKYLYRESKKDNNNKKKPQIKEIHFRPNTDKNDIMIKSKKIEKFLTEGHKVNVHIKFKGREMAHKEIGDETWQHILNHVESGHCLGEPSMQGNKFMATLVPGAPKENNTLNKDEKNNPSNVKQKPAQKKKAKSGM